jgi:class 3 adenylate cyclase
MPDLPSGTVTFLFTDIEGSTKHYERDRPAPAREATSRIA